MDREATDKGTARAAAGRPAAVKGDNPANSGAAHDEHATTDRLASRAHRTVDQAAEHASRAEQYLREGIGHAEERIRETSHDAKVRSDELLSSIGTYVRENPLTSIGIAFAAGTLFSALTRGRR